MSVQSVFEYALLRVVPSIERGECLNVGVVLLCRQRRFLSARLHVDRARLLALAPGLDLESLQQQLDHIPLVCAGGAAAGPLGELPVQERFRWLTAPRSTILQTSAVHCGLSADPAGELEKLYATLVI